MSEDDDGTAVPSPQVVEEVFTREGQLFEVEIAGRVLRTTPEPFLVQGQGWTAAGELQPGNLVSTATGPHHETQWLAVESVTDAHQSVTVYNFRVSEYHTYFIAPADLAFDVWVHNAYGAIGTQNAVTAWAAKTGRAYDRRFRRFWRQFEGQTVGDGIEVAYVNRRLATGVQPDFVLIDRKQQIINIHDWTSQASAAHPSKGENYVKYFTKNYPGYKIQYTESYWRGKEHTIEAMSPSGTKYYPGATMP